MCLIRGSRLQEGSLKPDTREPPARGIVEGLREFGVLVYGYDPVLTRGEVEGFGVKALDDMSQVTDYTSLPEAWMV